MLIDRCRGALFSAIHPLALLGNRVFTEGLDDPAQQGIGAVRLQPVQIRLGRGKQVASEAQGINAEPVHAIASTAHHRHPAAGHQKVVGRRRAPYTARVAESQLMAQGSIERQQMVRLRGVVCISLDDPHRLLNT